MSAGRSARMRSIASRASSTARPRSPSLSISTVVVETPGEIVEVTRLTPSTDVSAASMRCVICVSISAGAAPACATVTVKPPKSTFGSWLIGRRPYAVQPANSSARMSRIGGIGLRIAPAEMFQAMTRSALPAAQSAPGLFSPLAAALSSRRGVCQRRALRRRPAGTPRRSRRCAGSAQGPSTTSTQSPSRTPSATLARCTWFVLPSTHVHVGLAVIVEHRALRHGEHVARRQAAPSPRRYMPARTRVPRGSCEQRFARARAAVDRSGQAAQRAFTVVPSTSENVARLAVLQREHVGFGDLRGDFQSDCRRRCGRALGHRRRGRLRPCGRSPGRTPARAHSRRRDARSLPAIARARRRAAHRRRSRRRGAASIASAESAPESRIDSARSYSPRARTAADCASATLACAARVCACASAVSSRAIGLALRAPYRLHRPGVAECARRSPAPTPECRAPGALRR